MGITTFLFISAFVIVMWGPPIFFLIYVAKNT